MSYRATREIEIGEDVFEISIAFTVLPGRPAGRIDPEEHPTPEISDIKLIANGREFRVTDAFYAQALEAIEDEWLLAQANELEQIVRDDHADNERERRREDRDAD